MSVSPSSVNATSGTSRFTERAPKLGGLIEFYRSPARVQWTPTGNNVPDYPKLAQLWWQNIGDASSGAKTPQAAMDALAAAQDSVLERLEKSGVQGDCGPKLNKKETAEFWFAKSEKDGNVAPAAQAGEREAEGRDRRLRHADQVVAGHPAEAGGGEVRLRYIRVMQQTEGRERSRPFFFPSFRDSRSVSRNPSARRTIQYPMASGSIAGVAITRCAIAGHDE